MSTLFEPVTIGYRRAKNRFIRAATYDAMGDTQGRVTPELIRHYEVLGRGGAGSIVMGFMHVSTQGRGGPRSLGLDSDDLIPGLRRLVDVIEAEESLAIFQPFHAGAAARKLVTGSKPKGPSPDRRDPLTLEKASALTKEEIAEVVRDYGEAARRAREAGADGVEVGCGGGFLLNQFISPFWNHRTDEYGQTPEGCYRIVRRYFMR